MTNEPNPAGPPPDALPPAGNAPTTPFNPGPPVVATQIPLPHAGSTSTPPSSKSPGKAPVHHDSFREFIETIVFVVVLVLILKTFLAEAFVIPTGSMATTLLGYHGEVTCEQCGYRFLINKSKEADPAEHHPQRVTGCVCPNCYFSNDLRPIFPQGGRQ